MYANGVKKQPNGQNLLQSQILLKAHLGIFIFPSGNYISILLLNLVLNVLELPFENQKVSEIYLVSGKNLRLEISDHKYMYLLMYVVIHVRLFADELGAFNTHIHTLVLCYGYSEKTGLTFQTAELHCSLIIHNDLSAEEDGGGGEGARACYTSFQGGMQIKQDLPFHSIVVYSKLRKKSAICDVLLILTTK